MKADLASHRRMRLFAVSPIRRFAAPASLNSSYSLDSLDSSCYTRDEIPTLTPNMLTSTAPPSRRRTHARQNQFRPLKSVLSLFIGFIPLAIIIGVLCFRGVVDAPNAAAKKEPSFSALDEISRSIHSDPSNAQLEGCFINASVELPFTHAGSLPQLPHGSLLCTWYSASGQTAPPARFFLPHLANTT